MQPLDRNSTPPGGWKFYQPETQWTMPNPMSQSWTTAVERIVQHRKANAALADTATVAQAEADLEAYTRSRLPRQVVDDGSGRTAKANSGCGGCGRR
jgi:hypothetical protein